MKKIEKKYIQLIGMNMYLRRDTQFMYLRDKENVANTPNTVAIAKKITSRIRLNNFLNLLFVDMLINN